MAIQTSIAQHLVGTPGQPYDASNTVVSGYYPTIKQVAIAITPVDLAVYTITVNGVACTFTAGAATTSALIAAGLVAAVNGSTQAAQVTASGAASPIKIVADTSAPFTSSVGANLVQTDIPSSVPPVPGGVFLCIDETGAAGPMDFVVRLPKAATDITGVKRLGVALKTRGLSGQQYMAGSMIDTMIVGRVWVQVEDAVTAGDPAFVRFAPGTVGTQIGAFSKTADGSTAAQLPSARYLTDGAAGGLAVVQFDAR